MISDRHRCVFVHIPKTAGTSISRALGWFGADSVNRDGTLRRDAQDHRTLRELQLAMQPADFHAYFKFTFVRNPWARVASWYTNIVQDELHLARFGIAADCTFRDFLIEHATTWGLQPLRHWVGNSGDRIELDFIGRFESLQSDFETVCRRLDIPRITLPHIMIADMPVHYPSLYDTECRRIVSERYAEEIEMLGYQYEG